VDKNSRLNLALHQEYSIRNTPSYQSLKSLDLHLLRALRFSEEGKKKEFDPPYKLDPPYKNCGDEDGVGEGGIQWRFRVNNCDSLTPPNSAFPLSLPGQAKDKDPSLQLEERGGHSRSPSPSPLPLPRKYNSVWQSNPHTPD
jgi:hypothetical protein